MEKTYSLHEINEKFRNKKCLECSNGKLNYIGSSPNGMWVAYYVCNSCKTEYQFQETDMGQTLPSLISKNAFKIIEKKMETPKYYTPEIEEFHVGFEFEFLNNKEKIFFVTEEENKWIKTEMPFIGILSELNNLKKLIIDNQLRVKHLDREDLESFGFTEHISSSKPRGIFNKIILRNIFWIDLFEDRSIRIAENDNLLFHGTIKNKSELKKLMKQLDIS